jgi:hypothetical protein
MVTPARTEGYLLPLRNAPVLILALLAVSWVTLRIGTATSSSGETAAMSANDRSRWSTVAALVHYRTYAIDDVIVHKDPDTGARMRDKSWDTIDKVNHKGADGKEHFYSSKPPLLPTLIAADYWLLHAATGWDIREDPILVIRSLLLLVNLPCFVILLVICARWTDRYCQTGWARVFAAAVITWGTFLTAFTNTLNNHLVAAACVAVALESYLRVSNQEQGAPGSLRWSLLGGAAAAFAAANELPALSFLCAMGLLFGLRSRKLLILGYFPAATVVVAAFFGTNWLAHGTWVPAYAHRSDGPEIARVQASDKQLEGSSLPESWRKEIPTDLSEATMLLPHKVVDRWMIWDRAGQDRLAVVRDGDGLSIRSWENWYDYPGSYWIGDRGGMDVGESSRLRYAFHMLIGHHGIFSLTPIWIISLWGGYFWFRSGQHRLEVLGILGLTVLCFLFYLFRPLQDRNYGGSCCGLRWMFWFIPLWFFCLFPALDRFAAHRGYRQLANIALVVSIVSAVYAYANPWRSPWIYDLGDAIKLLLR